MLKFLHKEYRHIYLFLKNKIRNGLRYIQRIEKKKRRKNVIFEKRNLVLLEFLTVTLEEITSS